jgi:hypothetical protein
MADTNVAGDMGVTGEEAAHRVTRSNSGIAGGGCKIFCDVYSTWCSFTSRIRPWLDVKSGSRGLASTIDCLAARHARLVRKRLMKASTGRVFISEDCVLFRRHQYEVSSISSSLRRAVLTQDTSGIGALQAKVCYMMLYSLLCMLSCCAVLGVLPAAAASCWLPDTATVVSYMD